MTRILIITLLLMSCSLEKKETENKPYVLILGITQDAGYPQINCVKECCEEAWKNKKLRKNISCIAIIDPSTNQQWIIDATPNIKEQLQILKNKTGSNQIDGILLTHAHIGHYTGLMHLGREAIGAKNMPVFTMPEMKNFLESNGPWSQLVNLKNITLKKLAADSSFQLNNNILVTPFLVPHRDEFSETVGYKITTTNASLIFIPDIDKWNKWEKNIKEEIRTVDYALIDGTFYKNGEIKRDMSEIPHPFVEESMALLQELPYRQKQKVHFIHFNHSNPLLKEGSPAQKEVLRKGFNIAQEKQVIDL